MLADPHIAGPPLARGYSDALATGLVTDVGPKHIRRQIRAKHPVNFTDPIGGNRLAASESTIVDPMLYFDVGFRLDLQIALVGVG